MGWYTGAIGAGHNAAGFLGGTAGDALGTSGAIMVIAVVPPIAGLMLATLLRSFAERPRANEGRDVRIPRAGWSSAALHGLRGMSPAVWLAFAIGLHINLLGGVMNTYFPLYGLAIGLSLTQVGALSGLAAALSSVVRFIAPIVFRISTYGRINPWMVAAGGLSVAAVTVSANFTVLVAVWMCIGLSRGLIRVSSAAMVMESSEHDERRGAAAGIYMAGLDIGKIIGPLSGGVLAQVWGYETTFVAVGLGLPALPAGARASPRSCPPSRRLTPRVPRSLPDDGIQSHISVYITVHIRVAGPERVSSKWRRACRTQN